MEQVSGKKRRLSLDQVRSLERNFSAENKLEHERKVQIAEEIGLMPRQVAVWFQNRRARSKTKKVENDYDSLNAEYDNLKNEYDFVLKINQQLKAEVWMALLSYGYGILKNFQICVWMFLSSLSFSFTPILIHYSFCVGFRIYLD